jgi:hypothetical protein
MERINKLLLIWLIFFNTSIFSQEFPTHFPWITDTVYISGSAADGGNGSKESPYNAWDNFSFKRKTAYLFKRGETMDVNGKTVINADSLYLGGYGSGDRPLFYGKGTNKHFYFCGTQQYIQGINIQCQDTGTCITFLGDSSKFVWADSMELSHAWWGTNPGGYGKIILSNLYVHRTRVDGIYASNNDTLIIRNTKVHDVNRWYEYIQDINTSGGDCLQGVSNDYVIIDGCNLNHSANPGKFALILTGTDTAIIKSSTIMGYDLSAAVYVGGSKRGWHFDGCKIIGGTYGLWNHGYLVVQNCVFKGNWKSAIQSPKGILCNNVFADNPGGRAYTNSSGSTVYSRGIALPVSGDNTRLLVYNNIFYNIKQSIECFSKYIGSTILVSNNDYYNDSTLFEEQPKNQVGENALNINPKFDFARDGTTDYYLLSNSSLIDAGLDLSTIGIALACDINDKKRPNGYGYDIGAYEYYENSESNLEDNYSTKVKLFPNPANDLITVKSENENIQQIKIYSINGSEMRCIKNISETEYYLDLSRYHPAIYLVKVYLLNETYLLKVLKE